MKVKFFSLFVVFIVILSLSIQGSQAAIKKKRACKFDCDELCQLRGISHGTCAGSICRCTASPNSVVEDSINDSIT